MIISDLYGVSVMAGTIEATNRFSKLINKFNKNRVYKKVCKSLDKITEYLSNTEIEDFIYVMSMYSKENTHGFDIKGMTVHTRLISAAYKSMVFTFKENGSNDIRYIKYEDAEISVAESHEKEYIQYNSSNMGEFDFDPREYIGIAVNGVMKNVCKDLIYREEE